MADFHFMSPIAVTCLKFLIKMELIRLRKSSKGGLRMRTKDAPKGMDPCHNRTFGQYR